jgi:hypothetical protein
VGGDPPHVGSDQPDLTCAATARITIPSSRTAPPTVWEHRTARPGPSKMASTPSSVVLIHLPR